MIQIYIFVGVGFFLILVGILRQIDWFSVFNKFYGNDPKKGKIYVDYGENEIFYDGDYIFSDDTWLYYEYKVGHFWFTVAVPIDWKFLFIRGRRKILVDFGSEFAKPLDADDKIPPTMGALLLTASIQKKLAVDMVNSIESHKGWKIGMLLIAVAIIAVGVIYWKTHSEKPVTPPENNQPAISQNITAPTYSPEDQAIIDKANQGGGK